MSLAEHGGNKRMWAGTFCAKPDLTNSSFCNNVSSVVNDKQV